MSAGQPQSPTIKDLCRRVDLSRQAYTGLLGQQGLPISMTEQNHCYENAQAERVNGILKVEYGLEHRFASKALALGAIGQAIGLYNERRPHMALGYRTPAAVHAEAA